ncbi:MAG TPA: hypothetical protein VF268_09190 [Gammaproteobacteria bacterium]
MKRLRFRQLLLPLCLILSGCFTDAATRLAFDIETGVERLGRETGATYSIRHITPSKSGECIGPYTVQIDKVGALIIWCRDAAGNTVSSHSTTYHSRFVDTPKTYILEKPANSTLVIDIERRGNLAVITSVR